MYHQCMCQVQTRLVSEGGSGGSGGNAESFPKATAVFVQEVWTLERAHFVARLQRWMFWTTTPARQTNPSGLQFVNDLSTDSWGLITSISSTIVCQILGRVYLKGNTHPLESQQWSPRTYGQGRLGRWLNPSESVKPQNSSHTGTDDYRPSENRVKHYMIFQFSRLNSQKSYI